MCHWSFFEKIWNLFKQKFKILFLSSFPQFLKITESKISGPYGFDLSNDPRTITTASSVTVKLFKILFSFKLLLKTDDTVETEQNIY